MLHIMSLERDEIDEVSYILRGLTLDNQAKYEAVVGPPIAPPMILEPLVVASPARPADLEMDTDNVENLEGDEEENLIENEAMINPNWPPSNLDPWMMGDTSDKMSIPEDAPQAEDQEGITSDSKADEEIETYWETLCMLSNFRM